MLRLMGIICVFMMVLVLAAPTICAEMEAGERIIPQSTCPIMGGGINKSLYVDHEGKRIYVWELTGVGQQKLPAGK